MTVLAASKVPSLALAVGGIFWEDYGTFIGGETNEYQTGLMPFAVTGSSGANIGSILVAPAQKSGSPAMLLLDASGYLEVNVKAGSLGLTGVTAANGAAVPADGVMVGGSDGTDLRYLATDTGGQLKVLVENSVGVTGSVTVVGNVAAGSAISGDPVQVAGSDGTDVRRLLTDSSGSIVNVGAAASGSALTGNPVLAAGSDGTNVRSLATDTSGRLQVDLFDGFGNAISSTTSGGTSLWVVDQILNQASQTPGSSVAGLTAVLIGAEDPTGDAAFLSTDASGYLEVNVKAGGGGAVYGPTAAGSAPANPPVLTGGTDGTDVRTFLTDNTGQQKVLVENNVTAVGAASSGSAVSGNPVLVAGSDGTDARTLSTDASGRQVVVGPGAAGSAPVGNPILAAGSDGTDTRVFLMSSTGQLHVIVDTAPSTAVTNTGLTSLAATIAATGAGTPVDAILIGATDGTDIRALKVDGSGYLEVNVEAITTVANVTTVAAVTAITDAVTVVGNVAAGSAVSGDPVQVAGTDGTDVRGLKTDTLGNLSTITTMNQILAANTNVTPSSTVSSESATAAVSGACVAVTVACSLTSTLQNPDNICVRVRDTTTGIIGPWQSVGLLWGTQSSTLYFNMPVFKGDTVVIDIIAPAGSFTASKNNFSAVILGDPMPVTLRPDGRGGPLSSQAAQTSVIAATGTSTLVAAPAAGFRILLGWVTLSAPSAVTGSYLFISGTLNGAAIDPFIIGGTAVNDLDLVLLEGMLFDPATALVLNVTGTAGSALAAVGYDLVPI